MAKREIQKKAEQLQDAFKKIAVRLIVFTILIGSLSAWILGVLGPSPYEIGKQLAQKQIENREKEVIIDPTQQLWGDALNYLLPFDTKNVFNATITTDFAVKFAITATKGLIEFDKFCVNPDNFFAPGLNSNISKVKTATDSMIYRTSDGVYDYAILFNPYFPCHFFFAYQIKKVKPGDDKSWQAVGQAPYIQVKPCDLLNVEPFNKYLMTSTATNDEDVCIYVMRVIQENTGTATQQTATP